MFKLLGTSPPAGMSIGDKFDEFCRATSSPFAAVSARYSSSRLTSASTNGAKSQRSIHFPRLTMMELAESRYTNANACHTPLVISEL